ncbi:MAG: hypothetical protein JNM14_05075 [Ferruginibacter sp.]|nr:hypothetical protein [Ferruginibacter sp.]
MQKRQEQRFGTLHTLMQGWNELDSLQIDYCYVPAKSGVAATGKNNSDKIRPWFER